MTETKQNGPVTQKKRKMVLHFDIRNTMIVADTVTSITVEQALNAYLTGVLWGKEVDGYEWKWSSIRPSLTQPEKGTFTYYKHLEKLIVKTPEDRVKLRLAVGDFVQTDMGKDFVNYHEKYLSLLEWKYPDADPKLALTGRNGKSYHYILPAIYRLIEYLNDEGREFNIIIRTYGLDCENVLESVSQTLNTRNHPQFSHLPRLALHPHAGRIHRSNDGIKLQVFNDNSVVRELQDQSEIYRFFCQSEGVCGFVDDFSYWQQHNYHHMCAKPLWIDPEDINHHHILFDDNFRPGDVDSIVDMRLKGETGWRSLDNGELETYDNVSAVHVDLLEAIENPEYYVNKVKNCERLLQTMSSGN